MTWHKLNGNTITRTAGQRPNTERLPDGRWISGFDALPANDPLVTEAGWQHTDDPTPQPDNLRLWRWQWSVTNSVVTGNWVDDGPIPPVTPTAEQRIEQASEALAAVAAISPVLLADVQEALAEVATILAGGQ